MLVKDYTARFTTFILEQICWILNYITFLILRKNLNLQQETDCIPEYDKKQAKWRTSVSTGETSWKVMNLLDGLSQLPYTKHH